MSDEKIKEICDKCDTKEICEMVGDSLAILIERMYNEIWAGRFADKIEREEKLANSNP